ncbi:MAG: PEP/pyruvate-binding domain-containing protein, partial [Actinomycetota bacterium]
MAVAIADAYGALGEGAGIPVAVRSSATAEDLPFASFAGQHDTFLNVVGPVQVLDAVRRCWASLWTERAVAYRTTNAVDHRSVQLAVVVQTMVDAAVAGVMFTANPLTGTRHQVVIDAAAGLGEAVVSGRVNPYHFVVDADAGVVVERRLGDKRMRIRAVPGGGTITDDNPAPGDHACLTDAEILELARLGKRVEALYGAPQDTEWALDGDGRFWLVQARPVTTLYPLPEPRGEGLRAYFSFNVAQGVYRPITPMGRSVFTLLTWSVGGLVGFRRGEGQPAMVEAGERLFLDVTAALRSAVGRALLPRLFGIGEARSAVLLPQLFDDPRLAVEQRSPVPFLRRMARPLVRFAV